MSRPRAIALLITVVLCLIAQSETAFGQVPSGNDPIEALAKTLGERIASDSKERPKVTVLDFTNMQRRASEAGRYLALEIADYLVNFKTVAVLDRANLETIMAEHQLTAEGLLKPEDAKKLGNFAGVDAIVIGELSEQGDGVRLFVRAISTDTSEILASGKATLPVTDELRRMLGMKVSGASATTSATGGTSVVATEGEAIAVREIGPVRATLRGVSLVQIPGQRRGNQLLGPLDTSDKSVNIPAIRCTFALENLDLDKSVAIAANQSVATDDQLVVAGFRGGLIDSTQAPWGLRDVRGVAGVAAFEATTTNIARWRIKQNSAGGVVQYITSGTNWDDRVEGKRDQPEKRYWAGSFSEIAPGETIDMTVTYYFTGNMDPQKGKPVSAKAEKAEWFELNMELVLGTFGAGEAPAKAKDLKLRNLTIDKVSFPAESASSTP